MQTLEQLHEELRTLKRQRVRDIARHPEREELLERTYDELESDLMRRIDGLQRQANALHDRRSALRSVRSAAGTAMTVFDDLLRGDRLDRADLDLMLEKIRVFEDHIEVRLKADVDEMLSAQPTKGESCVVQCARGQKQRAFSVRVISSGDPLEIFTDRDGEVILKKYSPIGELSNFAKEYTESLVRALGHVAVVCDKDQVVSAAGALRKELQDKSISPELEAVLKERRTVCSSTREGKLLPIVSGEEASLYTAQVITPILVEGEAVGAVILLSREPGANMGQTEIKVTETAAGFIGRQMEQ